MTASDLYVRAAADRGMAEGRDTPSHPEVRGQASRPSASYEDRRRKHRILKLGAASSCRKREAAPPRTTTPGASVRGDEPACSHTTGTCDFGDAGL